MAGTEQLAHFVRKAGQPVGPWQASKVLSIRLDDGQSWIGVYDLSSQIAMPLMGAAQGIEYRLSAWQQPPPLRSRRRISDGLVGAV